MFSSRLQRGLSIGGLSLATLLALTGCSETTPPPAATSTTANGVPNETPAETAQAAEAETYEPAIEFSNGYLDCATVLPSTKWLESEFDENWGIKDQIALTDHEFELQLYESDAFTPLPDTHHFTADRGVSCSAFGTDDHFMLMYSYAEFSSGEEQALADVAEQLSEPMMNTVGTTFYHRQYDNGFGQSVFLGEDWVLTMYGDTSEHDTDLILVSGLLRPDNANDFPTVASTASCSMFFTPEDQRDSALSGIKFSNFVGFDADRRQFPFTSQKDRPDEQPDLYYVCDGIRWYEGEDATLIGEPEPIGRNEECALYETALPEETYIADCERGFAEITGSLEFASLVLQPEFRGLE